jgi:phage tail-like protein
VPESLDPTSPSAATPPNGAPRNPNGIERGGGFVNRVGVPQRYEFKIDKTEYNLGSWSRVAGLSMTWQSCEFYASDSTEVFVYAGNPSYGRLRLTRAVCSESRIVQKWLVEQAENYRAYSGAVRLMGGAEEEVIMEWGLRSIFPVSWSISDLDPTQRNVVTETLELVHAGFLGDVKCDPQV